MGAFAPINLPPLQKKFKRRLVFNLGWVLDSLTGLGPPVGINHIYQITNYFKNKGVGERGVYSAQQALCMEATNCILK